MEEADDVVKVRVPGMVLGKARGNPNIPFDVRSGGQGEKDLQRMVETAERLTREAWAPILAIKGKVPIDPNSHGNTNEEDGDDTLSIDEVAESLSNQDGDTDNEDTAAETTTPTSTYGG